MTLFEEIIARKRAATIVHEDDRCLAFRDVNPQAPTHILIIPKTPIPRLAETTKNDESLLGHLLVTAAKIAKAEGVAESGYRITINNGPDGGETVPHLHVHLLAGRKLTWPPG